VIAFAGTWLLQLPMVLGRDGLGIFAYHVPLPVYILLFLASSFSGPTGAALVVTSAMEGKDGIRRFFRRYGQWRVGLRWYLFVLIVFPLIYLVAASVILGTASLTGLVRHWSIFFTTYLPALLIFPAFITWGEEPGWRGFALTRIQEKYNPLLASLAVGLLHSLWHLPVYIMVSGPPAMGPFNLGHVLINTIGIMMLTIIWTWVFNNARGSILIAVLLHASSNASSIFINSLIPSFPKQAGDVTLVIYFLLALLLVVLTRGRLSYRSDHGPNLE
jgi:membrane protease YdiL (CAAX protease family)